jgi:choline-glycine betaine transporter
MSLRMNAFDPDPWLGNWTIFFWATWIAWAPFVGAFIARISRGRTIRQFVLGVLFAPSLFTFVWFSVFGAAGIDEDRETQGRIGEAVAENAAVAFFEFIDQFPLAALIAPLVIFLVWIFFVAGADAGTVVLGSMSSDGALDPRRWMRLTWGLVVGAVAGVLLVVGGLDALQNGAIMAATPFGLLMVLMCWALVRALRADEQRGSS